MSSTEPWSFATLALAPCSQEDGGYLIGFIGRDGETDTAVYDTSNGNWFIDQSGVVVTTEWAEEQNRKECSSAPLQPG